MAVENRIETAENELKLLKNEVRQSLVDVRDFLQSLKLPLPFKDLDGGSDNRLGIRGGLGMTSTRSQSVPAEPAPPAPRQEMPRPAGPPRPATRAVEAPPQPDDEQPAAQAVQIQTEPKPKEQPEGKEKNVMKEQTNLSYSQVNLLANIIRWVSIARNEIGVERLGTFLDVYATAAELTPELKEVILKLAEVAVQPAGNGNAADLWSRLLLELHGILTGGASAPGSSFGRDTGKAKAEDRAMPAGNNGMGEASQKQVRLKLVIPVDGEKDREFELH